jgi:hypothetical protein
VYTASVCPLGSTGQPLAIAHTPDSLWARAFGRVSNEPDLGTLCFHYSVGGLCMPIERHTNIRQLRRTSYGDGGSARGGDRRRVKG